ncbi:PKD domain-containing protein [Winogradskyella pulchriflava]|uniref:PKD domain-containing protein n=1 Tax=Winogradskyella pulchriflava TaxID=1110688 RepID=A0ABV6Q9M4_9FLAO
MGKYKINLLIIAVCLVVGFTSAFNVSGLFIKEKKLNSHLNTSAYALPPSATITGTTTVCLNETPLPQITFTGSGGPAPYEFTYSLNGGVNQTISTTGSNTSITLPVDTSVAGNYVYNLISVSDASDEIATINETATVTVAEPPTVDFTFNSGDCSADPVNFNASVTGEGPFEYDWTFGDGTTSTSENPSHIYDAFGCGFSNYTASLEVTDSNGCTTFVSHSVTVEQRPNMSFEDLDAQFTPPFDNCGNNTVDPAYTINVGNTSASTSCITSYDIDWGDGSSETNVTFPISHTYANLGSFNMVITGYGDSGCNATETILVKNSSNPIGAIINPGNTVNLCLPTNELDFAIGSWGANPPDTTYFVDYGDGSQAIYTQADLIAGVANYDPNNPQLADPFGIPHLYTESNCPNPSYTITLIIATSCGETVLTAGPIIILKQPDVDFEYDTPGCVNTIVQFTNTTEGGFGPNCVTQAAHMWDFGDGTTSDLEHPTHVYTTPGTYTVTLTEENFCGVSDPVIKTICIAPDLVPNFDLDIVEGCIPLDVTANNTTDLSQSCGDETYLWEVSFSPLYCDTVASWSFTNGTDETTENPSFQFDAAGTYTINMTVTNACGDFTTSQTIEVKRPPEASINAIADACGSASFNPSATVNACAPNTDTITYNWSFPGGVPATSNQLDPGTIAYSTPGNYTVTFSVTNACGTVTVTEDFSVNESPTITNTDFDQTLCSGNDSNAIVLTSDNANTTYTWTSNNPAGLTGFIPNGTGDTIPAQTLINTLGTSINLTYTVTPEINGCVGPSQNFTITIEPAPFIDVQPQPEAICLNGTPNDLTVSYQGTGTPSYQWYVNTVDDTTSGTAIAGANGPTYTPPTASVGTLYYYVVITFTTGDCNEIISDTAEITVEEIAQIDSEPIPTQSICVGGMSEELLVSVTGGAGTVSYQWYSNTSNTNTGGTAIAGATSVSYTPPVFTSSGTFYYYVEISHTGSGCSELVSTVAEIIVVDDPDITSPDFGMQSVCQNSVVDPLDVVVSGGLGNISYQWYVNTVNDSTTGTPIAGATSANYTPPSNVVGTFYYYCIVTQDVSGCAVTSSVATMEVTAAAQFSTQPLSDVLCLGETTSALSVSYTNGTGTPSYQWYQNTVNDITTGTPIAGATTDTYQPLVATVGTNYYYVVITFNTGGCSEIVSNTAEIIVNDTPSISDATALICSGTSFEHIPDASNGDNVPVNTLYTWTDPVVTPAGSVTGASAQATPVNTISQLLINTTINPATVTYTVTPSAGPCVGDDFTVTVTVNPSITVSDVVVNNSCFQSNDASIAITIEGGVPFTTGSPYVVSWTGPNGFTSSNEDISSLEAGTYTLEVLDDGGCPFTASYTITEPDILSFSTIDFDPDSISCFGANDGTIGINISGGTLPYTYSWTLNGAPFSANEDLSNLGPGTYAVSVTDANNCGPITQSFELIEPTLLEVSLDSQTNVLCYGDATGAITVNVSGGRPDYTYSWVGPNGYTNVIQDIDNLLAGTYTLTLTDTSGCEAVLDVEIIQNDEINIAVTVTEIECYGDNNASITIDTITGGVAPYTIAWSNFGTGMVQDNLSAGTYTITITDALNCMRDFPIVIDEAPLFLIDPVVTQMSCSGENDASIVLNFQGGIAPVTVVWDDDATAGIERHNLAPGTYNVTITDGMPCVIQASFTIFNILPLQLSANTSDALDCDDPNSGSINLLIQGGTPPFTVQWSNGATTEDLIAIPPNTYVVEVTDANGCTIEGSWDINRFDPLEVTVETQSDVDCDAKTVHQTFVATATGGVPPFQYTWSSGTVSGTNNELMTTTEDGLVLLEVTDSLGCTTNYSLNVAIPVLGDPDFDVSSFGYLNYGVYAIQDPITFTNTATGDYQSILWDFGDGSFSSEENPVHTYFQIGSYVVTQTVTYPFGCVYERVITLIVEKGYKLVMPDAFTPNEDGINDNFGPVYIGLNSIELNIYDTWGSLVYSDSGDAIEGWDGKIKDEIAENGNYYYTLTAKTFYDKEIKAQGAFVFIK